MQARKYTLREIADEYRKDQKKTVKESTYRRNIFSQDSVLKLLDENAIADNLTARYIRERFQASGKDPSTLNEYVKRFRPMLRWTYRSDMIQSLDCLDRLERFKDAPHREKIADKFLKADELVTLLDAMNQPLWRMVTKLMAMSGLRICEVIALERSNVDYQNHVIHVTKNFDHNNEVVNTPMTLCSIRDVYMHTELEECCREINSFMMRRQMIRGIRTPLFIFSRDGGHMEYYTYNKYLKETSSRVLDHPITTHVLRHTHASLLFEQGTHIDMISCRPGQENSAVTRRIYLHITERLKEKDNELISKIRVM